MSKKNQRQSFETKLVQTRNDEFKVLFEHAPVALVEGIWETSLKVLKVNNEALKLFASDSLDHFSNGFNKLMVRMPRRALLELLSARLKSDLYEVELKLPTFKRSSIYVFMRMAYIPGSKSGPQHVVIAFQDITQQKRQENFLKRLSQVDGLTQVLNQRTILTRLDEELSRAKRYNIDLACMILDLDNFKKVNDTLGHLIGDKCIKSAAAVLKSCLRKTDIIGRYGGDEFLIILPETKLASASVPAKRLMDAFAEHAEIKFKGKSVTTSFSIGISGYPQPAIASGKDLITAADKALYTSKTSGGNQFNF